MIRYILAAVVAVFSSSAFAQDMGVYTEIYGGARVGGPYEYLTLAVYDTKVGSALGGAIGLTTPVPGLAFELDVLKTTTQTMLGLNVDTLNLMANTEYALALSDSFSIYAGAGIGVIEVHEYDSVNSFTDWKTGYDLFAGARMNVSDQVAVFAEYKYLDTFEPPVLGGTEVHAPTHNVLVGLRFSF